MAIKVRDITRDPRYLEFMDLYYDNLVGYVLDHCRYTPTWQQIEVMESIQEPGSRVAVASGHGCFGAGTPVLMFDGSVKAVEEVQCGDKIMGHDGTPRTVHRLCWGEDELYRFNFHDGTVHVYNDQHILYLSDGKKTEKIAVQHWIKMPFDERSRWASLTRDGLKGITSVDAVGPGPFCGFELEESPLFMHSDGTILCNTGKSFIFAWVLDWHLRTFPFSNALLTATNIEQARKVVWKYLDEVQQDMDKSCPWMKGFFIKRAMSYAARLYPDSWFVIPKTASKDKPENLAGQHNVNYIVVVDEASGVPDANHGVLRGALTHERNRYLMASQPTRPVGHFAEAMTTLAKKVLPDGTVDGIYDAFTLNSEESPIVSRGFVREKLIEYGGHHSPEYQIKVLGRLPDNLSGYLIPKKWCEEAQHCHIEHTGDWGWVLTVDVAEGVHRDSSVWTLARVSGYGAERKVECVDCFESLDVDEKQFARNIAAKYHEYPALTIAVDADGAGRTVILELEEIGIPVERIHWGLPSHSSADQKRYVNQRAFAHLKLREAIFDERFRAPGGKKFVEQASKLPYKIDERGRYQMTPKDKMKSEGIKSPDVSDTCCFFFLVDFIPHGGHDAAPGSAEHDFLKMAQELIG